MFFAEKCRKVTMLVRGDSLVGEYVLTISSSKSMRFPTSRCEPELASKNAMVKITSNRSQFALLRPTQSKKPKPPVCSYS